MKNECGKTRNVNNPYEIWTYHDWEWRVLKKYQTPEKEKTNQYARWFCAVKSPMTYGDYDYGDVYVSDIVGMAIRNWNVNVNMTRQNVIVNEHKQRTGRCEDAPCCGCCD